jgi:hypothetical protein
VRAHRREGPRSTRRREGPHPLRQAAPVLHLRPPGAGTTPLSK